MAMCQGQPVHITHRSSRDGPKATIVSLGAPAVRERQLVVVIGDASGSMSSFLGALRQLWHQVQGAATDVVFVTFGTGAQAHDAEPVLGNMGGTNFSAGLRVALERVRILPPGYYARATVLFMTDGDCNDGSDTITGYAKLLHQELAARARVVGITAILFGKGAATGAVHQVISNIGNIPSTTCFGTSVTKEALAALFDEALKMLRLSVHIHVGRVARDTWVDGFEGHALAVILRERKYVAPWQIFVNGQSLVVPLDFVPAEEPDTLKRHLFPVALVTYALQHMQLVEEFVSQIVAAVTDLRVPQKEIVEEAADYLGAKKSPTTVGALAAKFMPATSLTAAGVVLAAAAGATLGETHPALGRLLKEAEEAYREAEKAIESARTQFDGWPPSDEPHLEEYAIRTWSAIGDGPSCSAQETKAAVEGGETALLASRASLATATKLVSATSLHTCGEIVRAKMVDVAGAANTVRLVRGTRR